MELKSEEKIIQLMTEMRDIMRKHDRGVRPTVLILLVLLAVLVIVTWLK